MRVSLEDEEALAGRGSAGAKVRGRMVPGVLEEQPGGPCSWSRESEEERGRRGRQQEDEGRCSGPCGRRLDPTYLSP